MNETQKLENKVFSKWVAYQLKGSEDVFVNDISTDLSDGIILLYLAKILTKTDFPSNFLNHEGDNEQLLQIDRLKYAITMFENDGIIFDLHQRDKLEFKIHDGCIDSILYMIWTLILTYTCKKAIYGYLRHSHFQHENTQLEIFIQIMAWANEKMQSNANIDQFRPYSFALCSLLYSLNEKLFRNSNCFKFDSRNIEKHEKNLQNAINFMNVYCIPVYIGHEDIKNYDYEVLSEKALCLQLCAIKLYIDSQIPIRHTIINRLPFGRRPI